MVNILEKLLINPIVSGEFNLLLINACFIDAKWEGKRSKWDERKKNWSTTLTTKNGWMQKRVEHWGMYGVSS